MGADTKIEWAHHTLNPWIGCQKVSPGCDHCYAETLATNRLGVAWGPHAERRRTKPATWNQARKWNREAARLGIRYRVFCASLADVLDPAAPDGALADLFELVDETPHLDWLFLTKRIGNFLAMMKAIGRRHGIPANMWLGSSIVTRAEMLRDGPKLAALPATVRFWSAEPLLEDLGEIPREIMPDWIIAGGESGPGARPMHPDWARSLRDQCAVAGVPFLFKQWGEWSDFDHIGMLWNDLPDRTRRDQQFLDGKAMIRVGKKAAGRLLDGVTHDGFPA